MRRGGTTDGQSFPSPAGRGDQRGEDWRGSPTPSSICRSLRLMHRSDWRLLALSALYAAVVIPISLNKGSDFDMHLHQAELLLAHRPVYAGAPPFGAWWPPLPLLALVPFAWLAHASVALAKGSFALANVACLAGAVGPGRGPRDARALGRAERRRRPRDARPEPVAAGAVVPGRRAAPRTGRARAGAARPGAGAARTARGGHGCRARRDDGARGVS